MASVACAVGDALRDALVRPGRVVMRLVSGQHGAQMRFTENQHAVQELAAQGTCKALAVAVLGLNAIDQMFFSPAYPFWSLTIIAMDVVALWGLCAYGRRENLAA